MSIEYRVDWKNRLIISSAGNRLAEDEFMEYLQQIVLLRQTVDFDQLVDLTAVEKVELSDTNFLKNLADVAAIADKPDSMSRLAIVVTSQEVFCLSRMYEIYRSLAVSSRVKVSVFKTIDSAMWFLGKEEF